MKISKIYISAFGGLKDLTLDLDDGFNVIFGENEQGKTTVMSFIYAMFYGTGKKTQSLETSLRVKYTPPGDSQMGGRIYFGNGGKNYCLERIFNKSDSTDRISLTDTDTGETEAVTNDIGRNIFGMGAEAFKKSMFIASERSYAADDVASGDLSARLSAVALTGSEDTSLQRIESRIISAKEKVLSKTGKAGTLAQLRRQREELEQQLKKALSDAKRKVELNETIAETEAEINAAAKRMRLIKRLLDRKDDAKNAEKLGQYLAFKEELDALNRELTTPGGKAIDAAFLSKIRFCKAKLERQAEQTKRIETELAALEEAEKMSDSISPEEAEQKRASLAVEIEKENSLKSETAQSIAAAQEELTSASERKIRAESAEKSLNPVLLAIGLILTVCGVAGAFLIDRMALAVAAAGAVTAVLAFVFRPDDRSGVLKAQTEIAEIKERIAALKSKESEISAKIVEKTAGMNALAAILSADRTAREKRLADIASKREELAASKASEAPLSAEYETALDGVEPDDGTLDIISKKADAQKDIKFKLGYLAKDLGGISYTEAREKLDRLGDSDELSQIDFDKAQQEYDRISENIIDLNSKKASFDTELKTSLSDSAQPEAIKREISQIKERISALEEFVSGCEICLEVLSESFASIRRGYGSKLNEKTLENFKKLTAGKYKSVSVNKSLQMEVERSDSFGMFPTGYLSTGTEDQAFLALRLAICDMISENDGLPVFLDDALSNYDDARGEAALAFLKDYCETAQVILFTCHKSIAATASDLGAVVKPLR